MSRAFYIENHSASDLHSAELSALPSLSSRPSFASKDEFAKWCHDRTTKHVFYTLAEPQYPTMRSSAQNPIKFLHGVIADFDGLADAIQAAVPKLKFASGMAPTFITTTFSGKARLLWAFEKPVPVFTGEIMARFKKILAKELRVKSLLPGLDEGAWENPHTPFELGTDWRQPFGDTRLPATFVLAAMHDASAKATFASDGPEIPLEVVAEEVAKRFPGRWSGPFMEGAKGVRFWDAKADNPTGCTIRATGVQAWTGESRFLPWGEILGAEFVKGFRANRIGGAVDGMYYDGQNYWEQDSAGVWQAFSGAQTERRLATNHGLSTEAKKGQRSESAHAMSFIEDTRRVDGAFPCLFMSDTLVRDGYKTYLNVSRCQPIPVSGLKRAWSEGFPFIAEYLSGIFDQKQLEVFLSWLGHFYNNARVGKPKKGHALFVAGETGAGKTLLSQRIVGGLVGGFAEASSFILGHSTFNESLFHDPIWAVDDAAANSDPKRHAAYSAAVKKFVANPYQEWHPKFRKAVTHKYNGRLIVTLNADASSITMLPEMEGSIRDKLVILKAEKSGVSFAGVEETVQAELPAFADWLSNWQTPDWLKTRHDEVNRFGHDAWHHPDLMEVAIDSSPSASLRELLERWRVLHFRCTHDERWVGTPAELVTEIENNDVLKNQIPRVTHKDQYVRKHLNHIVEQRATPWLKPYRTAVKRGMFAIARPEDLPIKK